MENPAGDVVLWRHDIDASVHRALSLAKIESDEGARATYFVQLSSEFYNIFESEIQTRVRAIRDLGHEIALHFDWSAYADGSARLEHWLGFERATLSAVVEKNIDTFSFHVPTRQPELLRQLRYAGMINAYAPEVSQNFAYCSDSNGYWRFERLENFLTKPQSRIQVLTHPEYWTDEVMSAHERIRRCVDGRARRTIERFDAIVAQTGRIVPDWKDVNP